MRWLLRDANSEERAQKRNHKELQRSQGIWLQAIGVNESDSSHAAGRAVDQVLDKARRRPSMVALSRAAQTGMLKYVFDYNKLESALLVASMLMLLGGMIFESAAVGRESPGYWVLVGVLLVMVVVPAVTFVALMTFELVRSLRFAHLQKIARTFDEDRAFETVRVAGELRERDRIAKATALAKQHQLQRDTKSSPEPEKIESVHSMFAPSDSGLVARVGSRPTVNPIASSFQSTSTARVSMNPMFAAMTSQQQDSLNWFSRGTGAAKESDVTAGSSDDTDDDDELMGSDAEVDSVADESEADTELEGSSVEEDAEMLAIGRDEMEGGSSESEGWARPVATRS